MKRLLTWVMLPSAVSKAKLKAARSTYNRTMPVFHARGENKRLIVTPMLKQKQLSGIVARPQGAPALQVNPDAAKYE